MVENNNQNNNRNNRSAPFLLILQKPVARYFAYPIEIWNRAVSFLTSFESKNFMKLSLVNSIETYVLGKTKEKLSLKNIGGSVMGSSKWEFTCLVQPSRSIRKVNSISRPVTAFTQNPTG